MIRSFLLDLRTPPSKPRLTEHQRDQACQLMLQYRLDLHIRFLEPNKNAEQENGDAPSVPVDYCLPRSRAVLKPVLHQRL